MHLTVSRKTLLLTPKHGLFASCHASTVLCSDRGQMLVAFFAGTAEGKGDTAIWLVSGRFGEWDTPRRLFAEPGLAHWNPVLHDAGDRLVLFYKVGRDVQHWTTRCATSHDFGQTWSPPASLVPGDTRPRGPVKNKLQVLANGDWLAPNSVETPTDWDAYADISIDGGRHWDLCRVPLRHSAGPTTRPESVWRGLAENALWENDPARAFAWDGVIQPSIWESAEGHAHMLLRSTRGSIYRSDSDDGGRTWAEAYPTDLPNNNSGLDVVHLGGGGLVLACNPVRGNWGRRSPLSLLASTDNGATWAEPVQIADGEGEFSYPAIIARGDRLYLSYTVDRKNIACVVVDVTTGR